MKTWAGLRKQDHSQSLHINSAQQTTCSTAPVSVNTSPPQCMPGFLLRQTALPSGKTAHNLPKPYHKKKHSLGYVQNVLQILSSALDKL